MSIDELFTCI